MKRDRSSREKNKWRGVCTADVGASTWEDLSQRELITIYRRRGITFDR